MTSPKKKVLVLHGWTQNGRIFKERLEPFCQECDKRGIELIFLDGPHVVNVDEIIAAWTRNPAFAQDLQIDLKSPELKEDLKKTDPRAWWEYNKGRTLALGIGDTFDVVRGALEKQRFDGVFGFSQGAALATIVSAMLERPALYPYFIQDGKPIHPPLQFCVAVCGFRLIDPVSTRVLTPSFKTPTLHIIGKQDSIVPMPRSQALISLSEQKRVIVHDGAHVVLLTAPWIALYCDFICNPSLDTLSTIGGDARL